MIILNQLCLINIDYLTNKHQDLMALRMFHSNGLGNVIPYHDCDEPDARIVISVT